MRLEWLNIEKERLFERYMRLSEKAQAPPSPMRFDGMPRTRSGSNTHEILMEKAAEALRQYYKISDERDAFRDEIEENIESLEFKDRIIIREVYMWNLHKPPEKRTGTLWGYLRLKKCDQPAAIEAAKAHFRDLLLMKGYNIE